MASGAVNILLLLVVVAAMLSDVSSAADTCICSLPAEKGTCKARKPRYYYNTASSSCELFYYGGCGGNDNNFVTLQECEAACSDT